MPARRAYHTARQYFMQTAIPKYEQKQKEENPKDTRTKLEKFRECFDKATKEWNSLRVAAASTTTNWNAPKQKEMQRLEKHVAAAKQAERMEWTKFRASPVGKQFELKHEYLNQKFWKKKLRYQDWQNRVKEIKLLNQMDRDSTLGPLKPADARKRDDYTAELAQYFPLTPL